MERRRLQIPSGMQDTLPGECAGKRRLEDKLRRLFTLGGYQEIKTPILEYYDALDDQTFGYRPEQVWKTFDPQARILAVRPDSTIPAVRLASGRLKTRRCRCVYAMCSPRRSSTPKRCRFCAKTRRRAWS